MFGLLNTKEIMLSLSTSIKPRLSRTVASSSCFVSLSTMLLQAYFPVAAEILGVQLAALAVSLVAFRGTEDKSFCVCDALTTGVFFMVLMAVCALIREVLGNATVWGQPIAFLQNYKISTLAGVFGGYLVLAILVPLATPILFLVLSKKQPVFTDIVVNGDSDSDGWNYYNL